MRKILLLGTLALAGCASIPSQGGIKDIQSAAASICKFVPTAQTVANILLSSNMAVASTLAVATAICSAVTTAPLADGGPRQAKVNGVVIRGRFVK